MLHRRTAEVTRPCSQYFNRPRIAGLSHRRSTQSTRAWRLLFFVSCEDRDNLTGSALQRKAGAEYVAVAGKPHGSFFDVQDRRAQFHDGQHLGWVEVAKNSRHVVSRRGFTLSCFRGTALLHHHLSLWTATPDTTLWLGLPSMRRNAIRAL